jgi:hypothetical protein
MSEINTTVETPVWNYTQPKGNSFSKQLEFDTNLNGATLQIEITGPKGVFKPAVTLISMSATKTVMNVYLSGRQTALMSNNNKWFCKLTIGNETVLCWTGQFDLRSPL